MEGDVRFDYSFCLFMIWTIQLSLRTAIPPLSTLHRSVVAATQSADAPCGKGLVLRWAGWVFPWKHSVFLGSNRSTLFV